MAVTLEGTAPYAPSTAILEFLNRNRNGGVPTPVTLSTLERMGISESLRPRTIQALKVLDYIDESGELTAEFANLRKVSAPEYPAKLAEMLRATYSDVFAIVDPATASYQQVHDAFRRFTPPGQIDRMVALFLALLDHTGQWDKLPSSRASAKPSTGTKKAPDRAAVSRPSRPPTPPPAPPSPPPLPAGSAYSQSVNLGGSVGTVTLSADVNPIALKGSAREFFYKLVDLMDGYEETQATGS